MPKVPRAWIVTRHDPLRQIDDNLWAINGDVPGFSPAMGFHRRMSIIRLSDGRLLFFNAVPVDDSTLDQIRRLGRPALLLVPHHLHAIDAHAFRERLRLSAYTAATSIDRVREILPVEGSLADLPRDEALSIVELPSSKFGEAGVIVKTGPRASLLVCDLVINLPHGPGLIGLLFRALGFTASEPQLPFPVRIRAFGPKAAVRADLRRLSEIPGLARIVPSHGPVVSTDAAGALRRIAERL
jgi:hypothetical protein